MNGERIAQLITEGMDVLVDLNTAVAMELLQSVYLEDPMLLPKMFRKKVEAPARKRRWKNICADTMRLMEIQIELQKLLKEEGGL